MNYAQMEAYDYKHRIKQELYENQICSLVGKELDKHYKGWDWWVECTLETGMVAVKNLTLDGDYGFYIPVVKILNETDPKIVMLAAGEILERYDQHAGHRKDVEIKRDYAGKAIGDLDATS